MKLGYLFELFPPLPSTRAGRGTSRPRPKGRRGGRAASSRHTHGLKRPRLKVPSRLMLCLFVFHLFLLFFFFFSAETVRWVKMMGFVSSNQRPMGQTATAHHCLTARPPHATTVRTGEGRAPCPNGHRHPATTTAVASLRRGSAPGGTMQVGGRRGWPQPRAVLVGQQLRWRAMEGVGARTPRTWGRLQVGSGWGWEDWSYPAFGFPNLIYASPLAKLVVINIITGSSEKCYEKMFTWDCVLLVE